MPISHTKLVDLHRKLFPNTCYGLGEWRRYTAGIWESTNELTIRLEIQHIARKLEETGLTNSVVSSVVELLRSVTYVQDERFDADPNILTFTDITLDLRTMTTRPHSPLDCSTTKLSFDYDPTVTSEAWQWFLQSTVPNYIEFLQEFAGYCLTPSTRYELAVWLWGPPGGGKSTFIEGLRAMLGTRCCILGLNEIDRSAFALSQLPGKTLAISTEQPSTFIKSPHILNAIISGEPLNVDRKFRDHITVVPRAKIIWGMNELPRVDGGGVGLFRRIVPVHFPSIPPEHRDPALKERVVASGMAIVNWALEGLARLNARGKFALPEALETEREVYRLQNDVPQLFIDECCNRMPTGAVKSSSLYQVYQAWCHRNGHGTQSSTAFAAEMKRMSYEKRRFNNGWHWLDLELRPAEEVDLSDPAYDN